MTTLTGYLLEHLGVLYRGFLRTIIPGTGSVEGRIVVNQGGIAHQVAALDVPMNGIKREEIPFTAGGLNYVAVYKHGVLDETLRDTAGFRQYYQGNVQTQGIDVQKIGRASCRERVSFLV